MGKSGFIPGNEAEDFHSTGRRPFFNIRMVLQIVSLSIDDGPWKGGKEGKFSVRYCQELIHRSWYQFQMEWHILKKCFNMRQALSRWVPHQLIEVQK
ncbi:hypothetical protein NPIL_572431 [Nephila pilipes]|uniref:Uncharacterized protein n=1 Tax=Nephila pilipes TaxID=299642 RepID=A0A8X6P4V4_NEPPI|nr:hypothetical protein NPIL_572431 [Nephila pilipes]